MSNVIKREVMLAFRRSSPLLISSTLSGVVFGALVIAGGLTIKDGLVMSGFIYSGAAQFVGLQLILSHTELTVALITTLLLSLRFFLYAISLVDEVKAIPLSWRIILAFGLIDAVFVMAKERFSESGQQADKNIYFMSCVLIFYFNWIIGTAIGLFLGDMLSAFASAWGLEFIAYATFVAMLVPYLRIPRNFAVSLVALVVWMLCAHLPYNLGILVACAASVIIVKLVQNLRQRQRQIIKKEK
ncbi:hypothetical protein Xbed_00126 [Xenorhabdus beddingii]|uniref:Branched-chain amino acid ABC transporter permease n=1 Tax=Xenorhabdus beddingii TaxID=40578 RepID=A0A1Y2SRX1_9GAMM|nr:AzlC family ABC transporter permease [Xenorhabdus beddingii]OTA21877.1 hypothetical protein Xbed_00126 [Xenorhabdus beddingii]